MTIDELKALLAEGKITNEQFAALAAAIDPSYTVEEAEPIIEEQQQEPKPDPDLQRLIQSAVDRATNKLGNENKKLKQQYEALKKSKLTEAEAAELDRREREDTLAERERALQDEKNRWYAMKAIKKAGLDDGGDDSLALIDFVLGGTETDIDEKVKSFGLLVKKLVKAEVDNTFKRNGRNPEQGVVSGDANPWAKESYNITRQMQIEISNPELAKRLRAEAGVK